MAVDAKYSIVNDILESLYSLQYRVSSYKKLTANTIKSYINSLGCIDTDTDLLVIADYCGDFSCEQDAEYTNSYLTLISINIEN